MPVTEARRMPCDGEAAAPYADQCNTLPQETACNGPDCMGMRYGRTAVRTAGVLSCDPEDARGLCGTAIPLLRYRTGEMSVHFDIFISAKTLDAHGKPTRDSEIAREIHDFFTSRGHTVFLSTLSLSKLGIDAYKKAIDDALDAAPVLIAVGTSAENLESQWVRYEWDSFFNDILGGVKPEGHVFAYVDGIPLSRLPRALRQRQVFSHEPGSIEKLYNFVHNALGRTGAIRRPANSGDSPERGAGRALSVGLRPTLVFHYDPDAGWFLKNVGKAGALDIIVAEKRERESWSNPVRVPPLGENERLRLTWLGHSNVDTLGASYRDPEGQAFTAVCRDDRTHTEEGNLLGDWREDEVKRHWNA